MNVFPIIRVVSKLLIPYILLFAFYVQFHGDYGPGGGFQAGVVFAAAVILYALVFGIGRAKQVFAPEVAVRLMAAGVLVYAGTGLIGLLGGRAFLDYEVFESSANHGLIEGDIVNAGEHHSGGEHQPGGGPHAPSAEHAVGLHLYPTGQHAGIFLVELGVGITVTAVMVAIFYAFASRRIVDEHPAEPSAAP